MNIQIKTTDHIRKLVEELKQKAFTPSREAMDKMIVYPNLALSIIKENECMKKLELTAWMCKDDDGDPSMALSEPEKESGCWWWRDIGEHPASILNVPAGEKRKYKITLEEID